MASVSASFTGTTTGAEFSMLPGKTLAWAVSGTFVGTVVIERMRLPGQWELVKTISAVSNDALANELSTPTPYRFRCSAFTSGTIVTVLSDYDNAFTPGVTFGGTATGLTYGSRSGAFTRIGNFILFTVSIVLTAKGSSSGTALVTGLPVPAVGTSAADFAPTGMAAGVTGAKATVSGSQVNLYNFATGSLTALTEASFGGTDTLTISGIYGV